jgi:hypothetical protein
MPYPLITPSDLLPLSDFELELLDAALCRAFEHDPTLSDRDRETLMRSVQSVRLTQAARLLARLNQGRG